MFSCQEEKLSDSMVEEKKKRHLEVCVTEIDLFICYSESEHRLDLSCLDLILPVACSISDGYTGKKQVISSVNFSQILTRFKFNIVLT